MYNFVYGIVVVTNISLKENDIIQYRYLASCQPMATKTDKRTGSIGEIIKIIGDFFSSIIDNNTIYLANIAIKPLTASETELTFKVPQNAPIGSTTLKVKRCGSPCEWSNELEFEVTGGYGSSIAASCNINLNPSNGVFANGADTAEITALNIRDAQDLLVPDGSYLLFEPVYRSNYSDMGGFQNTISPYSPIPYPARSYDGRMVAGKISGGIVKATYQAPTAGLEFSNPRSIRGINVYAGQPDWHGYIGPVNLILSYNVPIVYTDRVSGITTSPSTVPVCQDVSVTVNISGITDANGEIVPDGTPIRIDGGLNGQCGSDKCDRYLTTNGSVTGARVRVYTCTPGLSAGAIWSIPTNYYWGDRLRYLGACSVTVVP